MAREFAKLYTRIWSDKQFTEQTPEAQRLYMLLLSQNELNWAGVIPYTPGRWALLSPRTSRADIDKAINELTDAEFVVFDDETEELLVRTFIRNDDIWRSPLMLTAAIRAAIGTLSTGLREAIRVELATIEPGDLPRHSPQAVDKITALIREGLEALDPAR